ncbi:C39 family peptidase [Simiduia sp. 21SJ11W-1]|uniref:C39 family peptidase n=1 Tax=Simiduia sp. 21SJ11W-1 TaxID=2909669 RepID=UPI00209CFA2C|nr:C39 family peptidase [Simiduia sp. 21SJ11W-1]UTA48375.1 C39 family peptidase [Simiduia sp. 21SJ11W-1]
MGAVGNPVPYYSQLENRHEPAATCSLTSMAMVLDYLNIAVPGNGRTADRIYERYGKLQTVPAFANGFNTLAKEAGSLWRDNATLQGTLTELRARAAQGLPSVVHGWFTKAGHIVVVIGFDGTHYTVHDPYGAWNLEKWGNYDTAKSGNAIRYPKAAFEYAINDNGQGNDLWLHRFETQEKIQ